MHSSPYPYPQIPPSPPPLPYIAISTLILIYVIVSYLVNDFIDQSEENSSGFVNEENGRSLELTIKDLEAALPWFEYEGDTNSGCVVCLELLQKGEKCKCLPVCRNVFHAKCIDLWLLKRPSCPICRSPFIIDCGFDAV